MERIGALLMALALMATGCEKNGQVSTPIAGPSIVIAAPAVEVFWQTVLLCGGYGTKPDGTLEDLTVDNFAGYDVRVIAWDQHGDWFLPIRAGYVEREWCQGGHVIGDVVHNQAFLTIESLDGPMTLSLMAHRKNGTSNLPQIGVDAVSQVITKLGHYVMTVKEVK